VTVTVSLPSSAKVSGRTVTMFDPEVAKARSGSLIDNARSRQSRRERRGDLCRRDECILEKTGGTGQAAEDRPRSPRRGPARVVQCRHERRSGARGEALWAPWAISTRAVMQRDFRWRRDAGARGGPLRSMRRVRRPRARFPKTFKRPRPPDRSWISAAGPCPTPRH